MVVRGKGAQVRTQDSGGHSHQTDIPPVAASTFRVEHLFEWPATLYYNRRFRLRETVDGI